MVLLSLDRGAVLSVWIVNYNSADYLRDCVAGLTSEWVRRIIVLDNASGPGEEEKLEELAAADERIQLILSDTNLGFGGGHRRIAEVTAKDPAVTEISVGTDISELPEISEFTGAAGIAGGPRLEEIVWILNPDTVITASATAGMCELIVAGEADLLSPVLLTGRPDKPVIWFAGGRIDTASGLVTHSGAGRSAVASSPALVPSDFLTGAAVMMTRATWDRLGGFRDDLFLYWEDVDLSLRAGAQHMRMAVAGQISIWHAEGGSTKTGSGVSAATYYYSARNRIVVCGEFARRRSLVVGRGAPVLIRLAAVAFLKGGRGRSARLRAVARGSMDGLLGRVGNRETAR